MIDEFIGENDIRYCVIFDDYDGNGNAKVIIGKVCMIEWFSYIRISTNSN